jgi:signal peptidase II
MKRNLPRVLLIIFIVSINIGCDQSTKFLAKKYLKNTETIQVIDNFFILRYAENNGAFLSMFSALPASFRFIVLIILPSIALMGMLLYLIRNAGQSRLMIFSLGCILGGGISNVMIDRIFNNQNVVDFMNVGIGTIRSGIFNFADLSIMLGAGLIILISLRNQKQQSANSLKP